MNNRKVIAIIVAYNPDLEGLERLIDKCLPQVNAVVVVDNTDGLRLASWQGQMSEKNVTLLPLGENRGIAAAQNAGIAWAKGRGADHIILFDHDSNPPTDLVSRLHTALLGLEKTGKKVAAIGPRFFDSRWDKNKNRSPFSRFKNGRMVGCNPRKDSEYVDVDFLIASGSLIPLKAIDTIGEMKEELFIDYVDIEWGLRARSMGWALYGVWDVLMEHNLGDDYVVAFGRSFPIHSPLRHYYVVRNAVWLSLRSQLAWKWKYGIAYNGFRRFIAYSLFMPEPFKHICFMCRGACHGFLGRMGRL